MQEITTDLPNVKLNLPNNYQNAVGVTPFAKVMFVAMAKTWNAFLMCSYRSGNIHKMFHYSELKHRH